METKTRRDVRWCVGRTNYRVSSKGLNRVLWGARCVQKQTIHDLGEMRRAKLTLTWGRCHVGRRRRMVGQKWKWICSVERYTRSERKRKDDNFRTIHTRSIFASSFYSVPKKSAYVLTRSHNQVGVKSFSLPIKRKVIMMHRWLLNIQTVDGRSKANIDLTFCFLLWIRGGREMSVGISKIWPRSRQSLSVRTFLGRTCFSYSKCSSLKSTSIG